jgi:two-component system, LuxR family, response regulator FixJ
MTAGAPEKGTVFIVDDDDAVRRAMELLMRSVGLASETFSSADEFLEHFEPDRPGCLVLDIRMPGLGGLELQDRLLELGSSLPIIFITGHGDVPMAVEAMQKGAFDFIQKPFRDQDLLERISDALGLDQRRRTTDAKRTEVLARLEKLTNREREVMRLVVSGKPNKVIAFDLGVSQRTVEIHRARVMEKMRARSLADLVRMSLYVNSESD